MTENCGLARYRAWGAFHILSLISQWVWPTTECQNRKNCHFLAVPQPQNLAGKHTRIGQFLEKFNFEPLEWHDHNLYLQFNLIFCISYPKINSCDYTINIKDKFFMYVFLFLRAPKSERVMFFTHPVE